MLRTILALIAAPLLLVGCNKPKDVTIDHGWVRLAPIPGRPAAAYFTVHGGATDETLVDVSSELAIRSEMHETMSAGGPSTGSGQAMSQMKPIREIAIPARTDVKFAPGGRHVMLFNLSPQITPGTRVPLTFTFGNLERIEIFADSVGAGAPAP